MLLLFLIIFLHMGFLILMMYLFLRFMPALAALKNGILQQVFRLGAVRPPSQHFRQWLVPAPAAERIGRTHNAPHGDGLVQDFHLFPLLCEK